MLHFRTSYGGPAVSEYLWCKQDPMHIWSSEPLSIPQQEQKARFRHLLADTLYISSAYLTKTVEHAYMKAATTTVRKTPKAMPVMAYTWGSAIKPDTNVERIKLQWCQPTSQTSFQMYKERFIALFVAQCSSCCFSNCMYKPTWNDLHTLLGWAKIFVKLPFPVVHRLQQHVY